MTPTLDPRATHLALDLKPFTCSQCSLTFKAHEHRVFCSKRCYHAFQITAGRAGTHVSPIKADVLGDTMGLCLRLPGRCQRTDCRNHLASPDTGLPIVRARLLPLHNCAVKAARDGDRSCEEVAAMLGLSRQAVNQAEERALRKLRWREEGVAQ